MFHRKVYRIIYVRATKFDGDGVDIAIIDKFYFRGMCYLAIMVGREGVDGRTDVIIGLAIMSILGGGSSGYFGSEGEFIIAVRSVGY